MRIRVLLVCALIGSFASAPLAGAQSVPPLGGRAFSVTAQGFPLEPAPGTQDTSVAVRPSSTLARVLNPPLSAAARAASADLGLAEAYFGQQGPSAEVDTSTANSENDQVIDENGSHLEAHVDLSPKATSLANGSAGGSDPFTYGSVSSEAFADGSGAKLIGTVRSSFSDMAFGPVLIGSGEFNGRVEVDGTVDGAVAVGTIETSDATVNGVPVVITNEGFQVDETKVPAEAVPAATTAIQEFFSPGGFADMRVVKPNIEIAEDGSSARVYGGGVRIFLTSNDPQNNYFFSFTLAGGDVEAFIGAPLGETATDSVSFAPTPTTTAPAVPSAPSPDRPRSADSILTTPPPVAAPGTPAEGLVPTDVTELELAYSQDDRRIVLRTIWPGWPWLVLLIAAMWVGYFSLWIPQMSGTRERLEREVGGVADRYFRG